MFVGLLWKWKLFVHVNHVYFTFPQTDTFFPVALQSLVTLRLAFCFAVLGCGAATLLRSAGPLRVAIAAQVISLSALLFSVTLSMFGLSFVLIRQPILLLNENNKL